MCYSGLVSAGGSYFDSDDMASFLESHFEDLSTGPTAYLPLADQVCHLRWIPLWTDKEPQTDKTRLQMILNIVLLVKMLTECCFYANSSS